MKIFSEKHLTLLQKGLELFHISLSSQQIEKLEIYTQLLQEWGRKINLTAILETEKIITHHFLDSFVLIAQFPIKQSATLVDVGSGAGFPGVVCALLYPHWQITLVEKVHKKTAFLAELKRKLGLDYRILTTQIESVSETFDLVTSRATFPPEEWIQVGAKLVAPKGMIFAMLGMQDYQLNPPKHFVEHLNMTYQVGADLHRIQAWAKLNE